ncbi:MAG TPA: GGDEF domain-containing protein [Granulicella sp.]
MLSFAWFDNRTLIGCQFIFALGFTAVFLAMLRLYPAARGLRSAAMAFLLGSLGCIGVFLRGWVPGFISIVLANLLILSAVICVYYSIVLFTGARKRPHYLWLLLPPAGVFLWYFSSVQNNIVPRIVLLSLLCAFVMAMAARTLLTRADSFPSHTAMRVLGGFQLFWVAVEIYRASMTARYGAPPNYMASNPVQTLGLAANLVYICGSALCFLFMISHEIIARTRDESEKDPLSGALNRRGIQTRLDRELNRIRRGRHRLSIALVDIDHFKSINDGHGHASGDEAIRKVAETLSSRLRAYDSLGRFGGDEFLVLLPHAVADDAFAIVDRLGYAVSNLSIDGINSPITVSIGLTEAIPQEDAASALARADAALYQAKRDGRNRNRVVLAEADHKLRVLPLGDAITAAPRQ